MLSTLIYHSLLISKEFNLSYIKNTIISTFNIKVIFKELIINIYTENRKRYKSDHYYCSLYKVKKLIKDYNIFILPN